MLEERYREENTPLTRAFGIEYPERFLSPVAEYDALVKACGVIDLTHRRLVRVRGRDRASYLDGIVTNDVSSLASGQGCRALATGPDGGVLCELFVFACESEHLAVLAQGDFDETVRSLGAASAGRDEAIDDLSSERGVLAVEGPEAARVIHRLLGKGPLPARPLGVVEREFEDFRVLVTSQSATGESGFHVIAPAAEIERIREYLVQAARGSDGLPVGRAAWNARRVEAGLPWYGIDFTSESSPADCRLGDTVSAAKPRFRGREALVRTMREGRGMEALVGFAAEDESGAGIRGEDLDLSAHFPSGSPLYTVIDAVTPRGGAPGEPVGRVTSAVYSPALRRPLFMGYLRRDAIREGRLFFDLGCAHGAVRLRAIDLPLHTPRP